MKITKSELKRIIAEDVVAVELQPQDDHSGRDLGYGEGEGRMTRSQLHKIGRYAQSLHDMIHDDDDLPEWVQSKVATMASDIGKVKHYLEYKIMRMESGDA